MLVGLLALARFAIAAAAWDTGNGFALMGAARDLMIAVFGEALLVLALLVAALPAHSTDLRGDERARPAGAHIWSEPAHWCGAIAFALVILVETGRQPIDNPDTHLELTMIHEGPLLEYAGRDLALPAVGGRRAALGGAGARRRAVPAPPARRSARALGACSPAVARALCVGARGDRDRAGEDADPAGARRCLAIGCAIALAGVGPVDRRGRRRERRAGRA